MRIFYLLAFHLLTTSCSKNDREPNSLAPDQNLPSDAVCLYDQCNDFSPPYLSNSSERDGIENTSAIYFIDSQFDLNHPALISLKPVATYSAVNEDEDISIEENMPCSFHGTSTLSILVGSSISYYQKVNNLVLVELSKCGDYNWTIDSLNRSLDFIRAHKSSNKFKNAVINMSFGNPIKNSQKEKLHYLDSTVKEMLSEGFLFVAAAGNNGESNTPELSSIENNFPSYLHKENGFITVGSLDADNERSSFTSKGTDIFVPGENIYTAVTHVENRTYHLIQKSSATSYSAPLMTAYALGIWEENSSLSNREIEALIYRKAEIRNGYYFYPSF